MVNSHRLTYVSNGQSCQQVSSLIVFFKWQSVDLKGSINDGPFPFTSFYNLFMASPYILHVSTLFFTSTILFLISR